MKPLITNLKYILSPYRDFPDDFENLHPIQKSLHEQSHRFQKTGLLFGLYILVVGTTNNLLAAIIFLLLLLLDSILTDLAVNGSYKNADTIEDNGWNFFPKPLYFMVVFLLSLDIFFGLFL